MRWCHQLSRGSESAYIFLIEQAILSILFYSRVWLLAIQNKTNKDKITETPRPMKRILVGLCVSCSDFSLDVLSRIPPTDILMEEKVRKANKVDPSQSVNLCFFLLMLCELCANSSTMNTLSIYHNSIIYCVFLWSAIYLSIYLCPSRVTRARKFLHTVHFPCY